MKWDKNAKEFEVNVNYNENKGTRVTMPKPVLLRLGNPDKIKFLIEGKMIRIVSSL